MSKDLSSLVARKGKREEQSEDGPLKSVTIKLKPKDYRRLKLMGAQTLQTNQDIGETAILDTLAKHGV